MKLYTEEEVIELMYWISPIYMDREDIKIFLKNKSTPIELPSDEEIGKEDIINHWNWLNDGYVIRRSLPTIEELIGWFEKCKKEQIKNQIK